MAYTTHDGGQYTAPLMHQQLLGWADMPMSGSSFFDSTDTFTHQQSVLDPGDHDLINGFFDDPESAMKANFSFDLPVANQRANSENESGQANGLHFGNQTIHNPTVTPAAVSSSQYQTLANSTSQHLNSPMNFGGEEHEQGAEEAARAASNLASLSRHGRENSHVLALPGNANAAQWDAYGSGGVFNNVHMQDNVTSPMTSSGRQSANSHHSQQHNNFMNNPFANSITQEQLMQQFQQRQYQMAQNFPRGRHSSIHIDSNPFNYMPNQVQQMPMTAAPYNQGRSRPTPIRFGSDDSFRNTGYHGPTSGLSLEEEKHGNLINVPLAAQAAANGHPHVQSHVPYMTPQLQYSHPSASGSSRPFQNISAASSPGINMGGLPLNSPTFNSHRHSQSYRPMASQHVDEDDYDHPDDPPVFQEEQPRKRRKSHMERDDDADYNPSGRMKGAVHKRDIKPVIMDDSGDEYQTPIKPATVKRRKSSMAAAARPHLGSDNSNSPSANPSPAPKQTSGSNKKKGRETEPRKNLSEAEKRQNHIHSEKQRRDLIKQLYDQLDSLVPALKSGKSGLSRSDVLQEIVAFAESIMAGNAQMVHVLTQLGDMEVADAPHVDADEVA